MSFPLGATCLVAVKSACAILVQLLLGTICRRSFQFGRPHVQPVHVSVQAWLLSRGTTDEREVHLQPVGEVQGLQLAIWLHLEARSGDPIHEDPGAPYRNRHHAACMMALQDSTSHFYSFLLGLQDVTTVRKVIDYMRAFGQDGQMAFTSADPCTLPGHPDYFEYMSGVRAATRPRST